MNLAQRLLEAIAQDTDYKGMTAQQIQSEGTRLLYKLDTDTRKKFISMANEDPPKAAEWVIQAHAGLVPYQETLRILALALQSGFVTLSET